MTRSANIVNWLDDLLEAHVFDDLGPNGLQVTGAEEVTRVATAVSATREAIERAVAAGAQLVLVHHGLFWSFDEPGILGVREERLRPLLKHDVGLAAYHLPLDGHAEHGNNAILAEALGAERHEPFAEHRGRAIGRAAHFGGDGVPIGELVDRVTAVCGQAPLLQGAGPERVRRLGVVSGSGTSYLGALQAAGLDALLTGETREHVMGEATERGVHVLAAGHYATETHGIRRVGDLVAARFGVEHVFIDAPNPV